MSDFSAFVVAMHCRPNMGSDSQAMRAAEEYAYYRAFIEFPLRGPVQRLRQLLSRTDARTSETSPACPPVGCAAAAH